MALKAIVKVGSVTNLSDARYCAGMGVDMLGFDINPASPEYVNPLKFQEITGWVAGVKLVGEAHGLSEENIRAQLVQYELDCLEISDLPLLESLKHTDLTFIIKATTEASLNTAMTLAKNTPAVAYIFAELNNQLSVKQVVSANSEVPLLVGYDVSPEQVERLLASDNVNGFALKGSQEVKPGFKDYDELADMLEALEADD
ncbi:MULTISPECIES: N-(5'-phosphoribosyl)anthranilate isomerase [unclassified Imperialibacter]|uniref:N-(5'-phosphoribosyl)anthranilate isomerase n=1 Tax=unclassified Imperialibacter TaxID=2629706 RepID=UPI00125739CA|nr:MULTISPECIES: N-(5'-phosphoribosyl)anthranilate isomerase [unclassified Imperialibacter]CAD5278036.1 putative Phosphoribosylanthranilate isomerase [Imperialibacter sp. 75]CAD5295829.1 putative Phosphoribosylanthranilate isomerase [Imperialibacter sp. 89]VVT11741.1 putative Phosphoribosylanthranilate isomerase [Imperialibacter sp. EC-SDR9]